MSDNIVFLFLLILGYLSGSFPTGKLVGKHYGVDIQKLGSKNIGFANVRRQLGWKAGLVVLFGDLLKGFAPVLLASIYLSVDRMAAVAAMVLIGSIFPVWLNFRGGKGVATCIGFSTAICAPAGLTAGLIYVVGTMVYKKSAPASLTAIYALPWLMLLLFHALFWFYVGVTMLITWAHKSNIKGWAGKRWSR